MKLSPVLLAAVSADQGFCQLSNSCALFWNCETKMLGKSTGPHQSMVDVFKHKELVDSMERRVAKKDILFKIQKA